MKDTAIFFSTDTMRWETLETFLFVLRVFSTENERRDQTYCCFSVSLLSCLSQFLTVTAEHIVTSGSCNTDMENSNERTKIYVTELSI